MPDIGIALRRPPTYGETSGCSLDLLRHGVPTIVNRVATFDDYPDHVVCKITWERDGLDGLIDAMRELVANATRRASLGLGAIDHVASSHSWSVVVNRYIDVIETRASRRRSLPRSEAG